MESLKKEDLISGQKSKKYRRSLAWKADSLSNTVQTLKFKMDCAAIPALPKFDEYRDLYNSIEGVGKGSLMYFLFGLINSGFRVFASSAEAQAYASRDVFDDSGFKSESERVFGISPAKFTPGSIILRFQKVPRSSSGRDVSFTADFIFDEYKKYFLGSRSTNREIEVFFRELAEFLESHFSEWKEIKENLSEAAYVFDTVLKKYGNFPSLLKMIEASSVSLPASSTISFDPHAISCAPDEELNPYIAVSAILRNFRWGDNSDSVGFVQENLTTSNGNGLAWLFSKGLKIFAETPVISKEGASLCSLFSVPESHAELLKEIQDSACLLAQKKIFLRCSSQYLSFGDFRGSFAGHIDSWVSHYIKRLLEIENCLKRLPKTLEIPSYFVSEQGNFLSCVAPARAEAEEIIASFTELRERAGRSLDVLLGKAEGLPTEQDKTNIQELTDAVNRFNALQRYLRNAVVQASKDKNFPWKNLNEILPEEWIEQDLSKQIPKLNGLSGGVPEEEVLLRQGIEDFDFLKRAQKEVFARVMQWGAEQNALGDVFEFLEEKEQNDLVKRPNPNMKAAEQAVRYWLNNVAMAVRYCFDDAASAVKNWFRTQEIFENSSDYNSFFFNRKGGIYKSAYDTKFNEVYALNENVLREKYLLWQDFSELVCELAQKYVAVSEEQSTVVELENIWMLLQLRSLQKDIPRDVAEIVMPESHKNALFELLGNQLDRDFIPANVFSRAFNVHATLMKGINAQLRRNCFYLRTKFCWQKNNSLLYRPKFDKNWRIPERYRKSADWQGIFDSGVLSLNEDGSVNVVKTFDNLHSLSDCELSKYSLLLQQLPHEWGYENPFITRERKAPIKALELRKIGSKGMQLHGRTISNQSFFRLVGPSTHKTRLDQMLLEPKQITIGDMTLLVDEPVKQNFENGQIRLEAEEPMMSLAVPLTVAGRPKDAEREKTPFTHLVGIDQGEAGIAYAVFRLDDAGNAVADAVTTGTIRIPSLTRLIKGVRSFRKDKQRVAKFNHRLGSTMFNLRKNVAGDVCHAIVGLMEKFNAFPVLEREVKNLESGSRQLSLVYKAVNSYFLRPEVDAHEAMRKQLWFSAGAWTMPEFIQHWDDLKNPAKNDDSRPNQAPLHVWPGMSVNAHYTSKICSHCQRNISSLIRRAKNDEAYQTVRINQDGEAEIYGEVVKLYGPDQEHDAKYYRRRNERVPLTSPLSERELSLKEFERLVKRNLRRPPKSLQSKDTSQSRYFCVFKNCEMHNVEQHADVNAAINIGRRFLSHLSKADSKE